MRKRILCASQRLCSDAVPGKMLCAPNWRRSRPLSLLSLARAASHVQFDECGRLGETSHVARKFALAHPVSAPEPMKGLFDEWLRIVLDASTMSDDQFVEIPAQQLVKRSSCEISMGERQPDVERNASLRSGNAL